MASCRTCRRQRMSVGVQGGVELSLATVRNCKKDRRCDKVLKACETAEGKRAHRGCNFGRLILSFQALSVIKSTGDQQLHEEAQAQHRPAHGRQEMLKAEEEGGGSLRSPNNQRSSGETSRTNSSSSPPRRGDTFLPGQGVISGLR
jgi:hypothetical protein